MKKFVAIVLCIALLSAIFAVSASALEASNTNTSVTYIPVFEDFFNFDSIFAFFEKIFNIFGFNTAAYYYNAFSAVRGGRAVVAK